MMDKQLLTIAEFTSASICMELTYGMLATSTDYNHSGQSGHGNPSMGSQSGTNHKQPIPGGNMIPTENVYLMFAS